MSTNIFATKSVQNGRFASYAQRNPKHSISLRGNPPDSLRWNGLDSSFLQKDSSQKTNSKEFGAALSSTSFKGAFSADIKITGLLYEKGLSGHKEEKVLVKIDAEPQNFEYLSRRVIINKFDVTVGVGVVPVDILLAQKFYAILKRKRAMGRDFYDVM